MDKWCVRYVNLCGEHICYDVYAADQCDAWVIAEGLFHAENPEKIKGFQLEGVYHYD
jgi:hypothetical protein